MRKGFASEAASACIAYAFDTLGWDRVIHVIHPDNTPSIKTAEKIGSRMIGDRPNLPGLLDERVLVYGQDRRKH